MPNKKINKVFIYSLFFFLLFVVFGLLSFYRIQKQLLEYQLNRLVSLNNIQEININLFYENVKDKLLNLKNSATLRNVLNKPILLQFDYQILDEFFENYFSGFGLVDLMIIENGGKLIYNYGQNKQFNVSLTPQEGFIYEDSVYISELFYEASIGKPVFTGITNFKGISRKILIITVMFDAKKIFYDILNIKIYQLDGIESLLLQVKNGVFTYISDTKYGGSIAFKLSSESDLLNAKENLKINNVSFVEGIDYRGEKVYAYINYLPTWKWFLVTKLDRKEVFNEVKKYYFGIFGTITFVTFSFITLMLILFKKESEKFQLEADLLRKQKEIIRKQYEYITRIANDAIVVTDSQNRIIDYNEKFLEMYGIENSEKVSYDFLNYVSENLRKQWDDYLKNIKLNGGLIFETIHKRAGGENFNVQVSAKFFEIEGNEYLVQIIRDFEERKRIEDELREAKQKAEESDRLKSNFLSMMSHEVRTPINIILGAVDILKTNLKKELIGENEHLFDMITRNGKRLLTLISDIIDISRIESNELKLDFTVRNVESLILDVVTEYESVAKNKGLQILTNLKAQNPYARIDEVRFMQIITNLLTNAIKFTSHGGITISTKNVDDTIYISVKDTGVGIPQDALKDIFKMFRQAHEGYSRNFEGAGLGLTITQKLTKMMGGEITVESEVNIGSTFTVIFPVVHTNELDENLLKTLEEKREESRGLTILIVSNNKDESFYFESLMVRLGYEYFTIDDGKKIISFIKHRAVDCVLYSINLENELQVEKVMEEIREKVQLKNLRIVALRSSDCVITEERLKEIGFNQVKTKPVSFEDISKILFQILSVNN